ncbi:chorismate mutase [Falsihalocynthiibacter sp. SS001]|uniref:chorismate mutase n=1 Tax=Falsihalocynthiibacter sp. SS001 TaxID=3349698 RepID=UPI0036D23F36
MRAPSDCHNMADLRTEIDTLDRRLIAILAERMTYIDRAAAIKARDGLAANIPERVEEVVSNIKKLSREADFPEALAESLWREMIAFAIAREEAILSSTKEGSDDGNTD